MKRLKPEKYEQRQPLRPGDDDTRAAVVKLSAAIRFVRDAVFDLLPLLSPHTRVNVGMFDGLNRLARSGHSQTGRSAPASEAEVLLVHLAEAQRLAERLRDEPEEHECREDGRTRVCDRCGLLEALDEMIVGVNRHGTDLFVHIAPPPRIDLPPLPRRRRR